METPDLAFAAAIARRAGALLRDGLRTARTITLKGPADLVTEIDRASEALLTGAILERFPDHAILGEEGGARPGTSPYTWLLDPVDGTTNYAHGFPYFCVTLALLHGQEPLLGVTYDPLRDTLFAAEAGRGAFCDGLPLRVSPIGTLRDALLSTGFPYDFASRTDNNAAAWHALQTQSHGVRRGGSAGLDLAYVAAGQLEAHWELVLNPWDVGAGMLLIREAGGTVTDLAGRPATPWSGGFIASNGSLHAELLAALRAARS